MPISTASANDHDPGDKQTNRKGISLNGHRSSPPPLGELSFHHDNIESWKHHDHPSPDLDLIIEEGLYPPSLSSEEEEVGGSRSITSERKLASVLRSRSRHKLQSFLLPSKDERGSVQRSNVPLSPLSFCSDGDDVATRTRLKTACQLTWTKFLGQPIINNNVKGDQPFNLSPKFTRRITSNSDKKSHNNQNGGGVAEVTSRIARCGGPTYYAAEYSGLYKYFRILPSAPLMFLKITLFSLIMTFVLYCLMVLHKPTQAFVSRHTQDWIYPFMRTIRFVALPFINRFPQFHELYEDACLLPNPFFEMNDVSCWPCESVRHVIDLTGFSNFTNGYYHSGIPFIVKDGFKTPVQIQDLYRMYRREEKLAGSVLLQSSRTEISTFDDLLGYNVRNGRYFSGNLHVAWKINRAQYARLMRQYFSRPYYIPNSTEISVQHFLFVDEPLALQYALPVTEFANVFVMQAEGRRLIVLVPVKHCRNQCKAISVALQPNDVLFYNWLFWRPISFPLKAPQSNELSVTYVGSFY